MDVCIAEDEASSVRGIALWRERSWSRHFRRYHVSVPGICLVRTVGEEKRRQDGDKLR